MIPTKPRHNHPPATTPTKASRTPSIPMDLRFGSLDNAQFDQQGLSACNSSIAERLSGSGVRRAEDLVVLAFENYAHQLTRDPRIAKAAGRFGAVVGGYRLMDRAIEILEEGVGGLGPKEIAHRIIDEGVEVLDEGDADEAIEIVREFLAAAPQQSESDGRKTV